MITRDEILKMPAGREMRRALINAGLWDENDERDPTQDIAAAWEVVEKLEWPYFKLDFDSATWTFEISDGTRSIVGFTQLSDPSPALAICRAALLAVMEAE